jgi:hypothetical protein
MMLIESLAGFVLAIFVAYGARQISYLLGGTGGIVMGGAIWLLAFAGAMGMALRKHVGFLIGFLMLGGIMGLLVGLCGWSAAFH